MDFNSPKISLDKSWKFTPQVLILIVLGIFVIIGFLVLVWYLIKIPQPFEITPSPITVSKQPPKENLFAVNAEVVEIDLKSKTILVKSVVPEDWNQEWKLFVSEETTLATFNSWQEATNARLSARIKVKEEGLDPSELDRFYNEKIENLLLSDFQVGDIVYIMSEDDLAKNTEIKKITTILLQEI